MNKEALEYVISNLLCILYKVGYFYGCIEINDLKCLEKVRSQLGITDFSFIDLISKSENFYNQ